MIMMMIMIMPFVGVVIAVDVNAIIMMEWFWLL